MPKTTETINGNGINTTQVNNLQFYAKSPILF